MCTRRAFLQRIAGFGAAAFWRPALSVGAAAAGTLASSDPAHAAAVPPKPLPAPTPTLPPFTSSPYRLPWPRGLSFPCVQGNNGSFSHTGIQAYAWDFSMPTGSVVEAARAGVVRFVRQDSNVGGVDWQEDISQANYVIIDHGDGTSGAYLHLMFHGALVKAGDHVAQGQAIAYSGATGFATGPHLHFMVEKTDPNSWYSQSIPANFADVATNNGVPTQGGTYISGNAPSAITAAPVIVNIANAPAPQTTPAGGGVPATLNAAFVADVNYPDGSTVYGGQTFTKAWTLSNTGQQPWPSGSHLTLQGTSVFQLLSVATVDAIPPGASANISVTLRAPTGSSGTMEEEQWQLTDSAGVAFGPVFWLRLHVTQDLPTLSVAPKQASGTVYFSPTGHNVAWPFLAFFQNYGGLDIFGYPRTEAIQQGGLTVQYFQRARMEYHPELPKGQQVQLTLLGDQLTQSQQPFPKSPAFVSSAQHVFFPQTGHSVSYGFLQFFQTRGDLAVFGYPISEELQIVGPHGPATTQYFQRARFEYHPEFAGTRYAVELGLLGDEALTAMGWLPVPAPATPTPAPAPTPIPTAPVPSAPTSAPAASTPTPTATPAAGANAFSAGQTATVTALGLKVHSAASVTSLVLSYLAKGNQVRIQAMSNGWAQVRAGSVSGWVDAGYLSAG